MGRRIRQRGENRRHIRHARSWRDDRQTDLPTVDGGKTASAQGIHHRDRRAYLAHTHRARIRDADDPHDHTRRNPGIHLRQGVDALTVHRKQNLRSHQRDLRHRSQRPPDQQVTGRRHHPPQARRTTTAPIPHRRPAPRRRRRGRARAHPAGFKTRDRAPPRILRSPLGRDVRAQSQGHRLRTSAHPRAPECDADRRRMGRDDTEIARDARRTDATHRRGCAPPSDQGQAGR